MAQKPKTIAERAAFEGFAFDALDFFTDLESNQTREWLLENKHRYETLIQQPLGALVTSLSFAFAVHDIPLNGDAKASLFRINRDVRFSKDKRPYKTNASAVLTRDGTKRSQGLVYIQIGAEECFAAVGYYALEPDELDAFRRQILAQPAKWAKVEAALAMNDLALSRDDTTVRLPRGFDAESVGDLSDVIRLKSFIVRRPLTRERMSSPSLIDAIVDMTRPAMPLLEFGWRALTSRAARGSNI